MAKRGRPCKTNTPLRALQFVLEMWFLTELYRFGTNNIVFLFAFAEEFCSVHVTCEVKSALMSFRASSIVVATADLSSS